MTLECTGYCLGSHTCKKIQRGEKNPPVRLANRGACDLGGTIFGSGDVEPVSVHHLDPCGDEVAHKFHLMALFSINFGGCAQLRI